MYKIQSDLLQGLRSRYLGIAEAPAIHKFKPVLCTQKKYVQPLSLPWSSQTVNSFNGNYPLVFFIQIPNQF